MVCNMEKIKIYIYGAGHSYNKFCSYLSAYSDKIEVVGIITTQRQEFKYLDGYPCLIMNEIDMKIADYIVVAVEKWQEIVENLKQLGIQNEKIILSKVFSLPYFQLESYIRLKKDKITILSNTCLGGYIYNELGLEYSSPTIWLGCWGENFLKFVENYEYYIDKKMEILKKENKYKGNPYSMDHDITKGILDNEIIWDFIHSTDIQNTIDDWNRRKERCNFNNIAIVMIIHTDEDAKRFENIPYEKKIGIYYKDLNLQSIVPCLQWHNEKVRYGYDWIRYGNDYMCSTRGFIGKVDWIKFLLGEEDYIRF